MKTYKISVFVLILVVGLLFVGCKSTPSEKEIKEDLLNYDGEDYFAIKNVTIDRELTEDKKDVIDCTVETSNEFADMTFYLTINYTNYDTGGWQIDDVQDRADYKATITDIPSDESVNTEVKTIMDENSISDYEILSINFDKSNGEGFVEVKAYTEEHPFIKYYKNMKYECHFERGHWNIYYDNVGEDVRYAYINQDCVGKTYAGKMPMGSCYVELTINKATESQIDCSYLYKSWKSYDEIQEKKDVTIPLEFISGDWGNPIYKGKIEVEDDSISVTIGQESISVADRRDWVTLNEIASSSNEQESIGGDATTETSDDNYDNLYGSYTMKLNNEYDGWCELNINETVEPEPDIYLSGYETGNHETAYFDGTLFKESDSVYTSYCESTEAELRLEVMDGKLKVSISDSIYDGDSILNGVYTKE